MKPTYEELERERNALAAQVERLRGVLKNLVRIDHKNGGSLGPSGAFYYKVSEHLFWAAESVLSEPPPDALGSLKAQWQAEAITEFMNTVGDSDYMWDFADIKDFSIEYIQRIQEPSNANTNNKTA